MSRELARCLEDRSASKSAAEGAMRNMSERKKELEDKDMTYCLGEVERLVLPETRRRAEPPGV